MLSASRRSSCVMCCFEVNHPSTFSPADCEIADALPRHQRRLVEVPAVEHDRLLQRGLEAPEVGAPEFLPFGADRERVGAVERLGRARRQREVRPRAVDALRLGHRHGVVGAHLRARRPQRLDQHPRRRLAHVVGVRLECEAPDGDRAPGELAAEELRDLLEQHVLLALVDRLDRRRGCAPRGRRPAAERASAFTSFGKQEPP